MRENAFFRYGLTFPNGPGVRLLKRTDRAHAMLIAVYRDKVVIYCDFDWNAF